MTVLAATLVIASDQTLMQAPGGQTLDGGQALLLRALKADSRDELGFGQPNHSWQANSKDTAKFFAEPYRSTGPLMLGRVEPPKPFVSRCSIPLTPMPVKPTLDEMSPKTAPNAIDRSIAVPPPAPACSAK
jgi:hypothetical protein